MALRNIFSILSCFQIAKKPGNWAFYALARVCTIMRRSTGPRPCVGSCRAGSFSRCILELNKRQHVQMSRSEKSPSGVSNRCPLPAPSSSIASIVTEFGTLTSNGMRCSFAIRTISSRIASETSHRSQGCRRSFLGGRIDAGAHHRVTFHLLCGWQEESTGERNKAAIVPVDRTPAVYPVHLCG